MQTPSINPEPFLQGTPATRFPRVIVSARPFVFLVVLLFLNCISCEAASWSRHIPRVAKKIFVELRPLLRVNGGVKEIGRRLGKMKLPNEVIEGTFLHLAVEKGVMTLSEAERLFRRLRGVPGFRSTLMKIIGTNSSVTKGHLYELRLAEASSRLGLKVRHINLPFADGLKNASTDIDLVLGKSVGEIIVECKSYASDARIPMDMLRRDMDSLKSYAASAISKKVIPVLAIEVRPTDQDLYRKILGEAKRRGVEVIFGSAEEQARLLMALVKAKVL